jgi:nicotinate-nucleotide adenylyltransferase
LSRIGLFGGTFDPPHVAHVALARAALEALQLDVVRWIPAGQPWQKTREVTPAADRAGPSFTLDTVRAFAAAQPGAQWFLIIGADQYAGLHTWRDWQALLGLVTLAVANRPGPLPPVDPEVLRFPHRVVPLPMLDISATEIRDRVARGLPIASMVPPAVARYIDMHQLYRD